MIPDSIPAGPIEASEPTIIDGSRRAKGARARAAAPGLDFTFPGGHTVRLPYPSWRYAPLGPLDPPDPDDPTAVQVVRRIGYPRAIETVVDRFRRAIETADEATIYAAAVVVVWAMLARRDPIAPPLHRFAPPLRLDWFDMDQDDAALFIHRLIRLISGCVDLDQDPAGNYLLPADDVEEPTHAPLPDPESDHPWPSTAT